MAERRLASGLMAHAGVSLHPKSHLTAVTSESRRAPQPRQLDQRRGLAHVLAALADELGAAGPQRLRHAFEVAVADILPVRYARLSLGRALTAGPAPLHGDRGVVNVNVASGPAVLEVATGRRLDEWERQTLTAIGQLACLVVELERSQGAPRQGRRPLPCGLVGASTVMRTLRERIQRVARRGVPVLIEGESGVGKELVARQIHELSPRARGPFVAVNCAALVESLLEAELFGIEDRTATGVRGRRGKFEVADGGTLFLDEIADLSPQAQAKLLRVVQEQAIERVGGHTPFKVDVRLVAATNRSLGALVEEGKFRMDLFYRLNCVEVQVPPLRARPGDITELIDFFLTRAAEGRSMRLTPEALEALKAYRWPGNVRELERVIDRAVTLADGDQIGLGELPSVVAARFEAVMVPSLDARDSLRRWGGRYARLTLAKCNNNKREACRVLGITYHTLQGYLREAAWYDGECHDAHAPPPGRPGTSS